MKLANLIFNHTVLQDYCHRSEMKQYFKHQCLIPPDKLLRASINIIHKRYIEQSIFDTEYL